MVLHFEEVVEFGSSKHGGASGAFFYVRGGGDGVLERAGAEAPAEVTSKTPDEALMQLSFMTNNNITAGVFTPFCPKGR